MRITPKPSILDKPKIAIVGEAPGQSEEHMGEPFVGQSGQELSRMLQEAGITRSECYLTNVFLDRPPHNKLHMWCVKKGEYEELWKQDPGVAPQNPVPIGQGKYIKPQYYAEVQRLKEELEEIKPNLVIALGGTALWALAGSTKIGQARGSVQYSTLIPDQKMLATYHPAAILRKWDWRIIAIADLTKAKREAEYPEIRAPEREIWLEPTPADWDQFWMGRDAAVVAVDTETRWGQVSCIGFAPDAHTAIVVPLMGGTKREHSYYDPDTELEMWNRVCALLLDPGITKIFQNGAYDLQYLWRIHRIPVFGEIEDTMLIHHALEPEIEKGLGFLGSVYTQERSWKQVHKHDSNKRDE